MNATFTTTKPEAKTLTAYAVVHVGGQYTLSYRGKVNVEPAQCLGGEWTWDFGQALADIRNGSHVYGGVLVDRDLATVVASECNDEVRPIMRDLIESELN